VEAALSGGPAAAAPRATPDKAGPPLSILIPTFMRTEVLWRSVELIGAQLRQGDEILVIDQNNPPLVPPGDLEIPGLRLLHLDIPSLTRARNAGIAAARNDLLAFLDDDIVPDMRLLDALRKAAEAHPGCLLTGMVEQDDKPEDVPTPGWIDLRSGEIRTNFSRPVTGEVPFFPGCLHLIPRPALPSPPWFDPDFRGASQGEEIDFALRAREAGARIVADPAVRIFHLKVIEGGCRAPAFRRRFFLDHAFNQALFYGRHGKLLHGFRFLKRLRGFIGFHTRRQGGGHDWGLAARALLLLGDGLLKGALKRL
jgi:GT2 family glycosyltransferase